MKDRIKWTNELIESEARIIASSLGHFPSNSELRSMGRNDISNVMCKNGGKAYEQELVEDILSLMASFSAKIYGKRSSQNRRKAEKETPVSE